ncbi:Putative transporter [Bacillus subtilis]|nr:Putative transporter [Bacillus subtilis]
MVISTGIIHTGIVYLLFFDSLRFLSTKFISIIVFLDPAVAIVSIPSSRVSALTSIKHLAS